MKDFIPNLLPLTNNIESIAILKKAISANRALAKLNGIAKIIPNQEILINSLVLQEAKDSSEIENIITTHDELYRASINIKDITNEVIFTPPQNYETIQKLLSNLEQFINEPNEIDPLINMAIIHYQFETIHPFYDGNGRTGRIINILYLILKDLLDIPILYLSRYIIKHKSDYYRLLQEVRTQNKIQEWILYMLDGVEQTSLQTIELVENIYALMIKTTQKVKEKLPNVYSKDLIEILFIHPYTKIDFLVDTLAITRKTASKYLKELENINILQSIQIGRNKYFINLELFELLKKGI